MKRLLIGSLAIVFGLLAATVPFAKETLDYQDRGNRWEGVKATPVSGSDIELISVTIDFAESVTGFPSRLRVRFYLPGLADAYVTVRELDNRFFYWMDDVKPQAKWTTGFNNEFAWDTAPVLRALSDRGLDIANLGAVVHAER